MCLPYKACKCHHQAPRRLSCTYTKFDSRQPAPMMLNYSGTTDMKLRRMRLGMYRLDKQCKARRSASLAYNSLRHTQYTQYHFLHAPRCTYIQTIRSGNVDVCVYICRVKKDDNHFTFTHCTLKCVVNFTSYLGSKGVVSIMWDATLSVCQSLSLSSSLYVSLSWILPLLSISLYTSPRFFLDAKYPFSFPFLNSQYTYTYTYTYTYNPQYCCRLHPANTWTPYCIHQHPRMQSRCPDSLAYTRTESFPAPRHYRSSILHHDDSR